MLDASRFISRGIKLLAIGAAIAAGGGDALGGSALFPGAPFTGLGEFVAAEADMAARAGWKFGRIVAAWREIETAPGQYDWRSIDQAAQRAFDANLRIQLTLDFTWPPEANGPYAIDPGSRLPADAAGMAALDRFASEAAARYGYSAEAFGVQNSLSSEAFPGGPSTYARLLRTVSDAVRRNSNARVTFGPVDFNRMEADQRIFYAADAIRALEGARGVFDAIEARVRGYDAQSDFRRLEAAAHHLRGQLAGTPYAEASVALITDSPSSGGQNAGEAAQAADYARRALWAARCGVDKLYWEGPIGGRGEAAGALAQSRGGSLQAKRAYFTAQLLNRIQTRYDLRRAEFEYPQKGLVMVSLRASGQKTLIIVWRETYASGQALEASSSLALKTFDIEGPYRQGLKKLPMVPDSNGRLSYQDISGLYFDLDGRPTILSQDEAWLRELTDGFDPFASYPSYAPYPGEGPRREERTPPTPSSNPGIEVRPDGKVYYY